MRRHHAISLSLSSFYQRHTIRFPVLATVLMEVYPRIMLRSLDRNPDS